jgi:hypothetical protein
MDTKIPVQKMDTKIPVRKLTQLRAKVLNRTKDLATVSAPRAK